MSKLHWNFDKKKNPCRLSTWGHVEIRFTIALLKAASCNSGNEFLLFLSVLRMRKQNIIKQVYI